MKGKTREEFCPTPDCRKADTLPLMRTAEWDTMLAYCSARGICRVLSANEKCRHTRFCRRLAGRGDGVVGLFRERRSIPKWSFVAGMILLALESVFSGLAAHTDQGGEAIRYWQQWRLVAMSFLPGTWLLFSFSYARGNAGGFLFKWRFMLPRHLLCPRPSRGFFTTI